MRWWCAFCACACAMLGVTSSWLVCVRRRGGVAAWVCECSRAHAEPEAAKAIEACAEYASELVECAQQEYLGE